MLLERIAIGLEKLGMPQWQHGWLGKTIQRMRMVGGERFELPTLSV